MNCKTCFYFRKVPLQPGSGFCMVAPPLMAFSGNGGAMAVRPVVADGDFCRQHEAKTLGAGAGLLT